MSDVIKFVNQLVDETSPPQDKPRTDFKVGGTVGSTPEAKKLIELLEKLKPGDSFNQSDLARKSGASRKLVGDYLKKLYPELGSGTGRTQKDYSKFKQKVEARDQKVLDKGFLKDYKKKIQAPKGVAIPGLTNKELAKKYYPELTETAGIARLEKLARKIRRENPKLTYKKISPKEFQTKRKSRLLLTQGGKQFSGTDKFPFHHIMPIGGAETDITTRDVTFISKKMNSRLAPFNKKLNGIADGISNNLAKYASTKDDNFLKRVDNLNAQALQIVDKAKKTLPKKFQGLIGFNKVTPILDENATLINTSVERIGIDEAKSIVGRKGPKILLKDLSGTRSKSALLKKIKAAGSSGPTLGMNLGFLPTLKTAGEVLGSPAAALAFATMTVKDNLEKGESLPAAVADKMVGLELLAPGAISRFAPGVMKGVLGLGRAARLFTPVGLGITAAGMAKDVYREYKRREALSDEDRLEEDLEAQEKFDEVMVGAAKGGLIPPKSGKTPHGDKGLASLADYDMTSTEFINGRY